MNRLIIFVLIAAFMAVTVSAQSRGEVLIKNGTVMTASNGTLNGTDVLIRNGKIARIGKNLAAGAGTKVIDATGKYVLPGIIDAHSHAMMSAINEGSLSVTSMTRIRDVLNPDDVAIYRALAGGVTAALLLHGSANPIGGQSTTVKLKWGRPVEDFPGAGAPPRSEERRVGKGCRSRW